MKLPTEPDGLSREPQRNSPEHASWCVEQARSWLPFFHSDPYCWQIPDEAVLREFARCHGWIRDANGNSLRLFWDRLLEEHGFESDGDRAVKRRLDTLEELMESFSEREIAAFAGMEMTAENRPYPRQLSFWGPEKKRSDRPESDARRLLTTRARVREIESQRRESAIAFQLWQVRKDLDFWSKAKVGIVASEQHCPAPAIVSQAKPVNQVKYASQERVQAVINRAKQVLARCGRLDKARTIFLQWEPSPGYWKM